MTKITALIITLNEERHIGACIDSLAGVADEVLVIDSFSADGTKTIAQEKHAQVIEENFLGFGPQRNLGAAKATHDLILVLDADERLSPELKQSILAVKNNPNATAYACNRLNHIGDKAIRYAGWYPDRHIRLYDRRKAKWNDREVHEDVEVTGAVEFLPGDLLHYSYDSIGQLKEKSDRYARLGATVYRSQSKPMLIYKMLVSPIAKFIKSYFLEMGYQGGYMGFIISYSRARETFYKYYLAL